MAFSNFFYKKKNEKKKLNKHISGGIVKMERIINIKLSKGKNLKIYRVLIGSNFDFIEGFTINLNFLRIGDFVQGTNEKFLYYRGSRFFLVNLFEKKRKIKFTNDSLIKFNETLKNPESNFEIQPMESQLKYEPHFY